MSIFLLGLWPPPLAAAKIARSPEGNRPVTNAFIVTDFCRRRKRTSPTLSGYPCFYKALEAALALPAGPERLEALYKAYRELRAN